MNPLLGSHTYGRPLSYPYRDRVGEMLLGRPLGARGMDIPAPGNRSPESTRRHARASAVLSGRSAICPPGTPEDVTRDPVRR